MTISQRPNLFEEILEGKPIPNGKLEYFRTRLRLQLHDLIVSRFLQQEDLSKADLARRIHRAPEVVNRLLGSPGNWTIDTISDLLIGMSRVFVSLDNADASVAEIIAQASSVSTEEGIAKELNPAAPVAQTAPVSGVAASGLTGSAIQMQSHDR